VARSLIGAMFGEGPKFHEDADGHLIREWKSSESSSCTNEMLAQAISNPVAVEHNEMLSPIPPSAICYMQTKGWLRANGTEALKELYPERNRC
jgi:hypothetical protein